MAWTAIAGEEFIFSSSATLDEEGLEDLVENEVLGYILPHRVPQKRIFDKKEAPMYVSRRPLRGSARGVKVTDPDFLYENLLFKVFWTSSEKKKFIFLTGTIGCGKSTLTDYFLRCYCPAAVGDEEKFNKKMILHIDSKGCIDVSRFYFNVIAAQKTFCEAYGLNELTSIVKGSGDARERSYDFLEVISREMRSGQLLGRYLVIVIDNIDQSPMDVQKEAITFAQDLCEERSKVDVHKIFFPMWPNTLENLADQNFLRIRPEEFTKIDLSAPEINHVVRRKVKRLLKSFKVNGKSARDYIRSIKHKVQPKEYGLIVGLSYNNLSLVLSHYAGLILSDGMKTYESLTEHAFREYQVIDSLVAGRYKTHNALSSLVLNPFCYGITRTDAPNSFLLPYLLFYLREQHYELEDVVSFFKRLSVSENTIVDCLEKLADKHVIHFDLYREGTKRICVHHRVRKAHIALLTAPAAIDNWAQTTPMPRQYVDGRRPTVGYKVDDFQQRVSNTLSFLQFLEDREAVIVNQLSENNLDELRKLIPKVTREVKKNYRKRMRVLERRNDPVPYDDSWWSEVMEKLK